MEHHLVKESVRVLEKLEREVSEQLARAHNDSLKSKLEELREHLLILNQRAILDSRKSDRRCEEETKERRQNFERREVHTEGRRVGERRLKEDRREVPRTLSSAELDTKRERFFPSGKKLQT